MLEFALSTAIPFLLLAGFILLLYALLGDALRLRFRRRRRCPKCWYDLSATPGRRCSECGHEAERERELWRYRRKWRIAAAAFVLLIVSERTLLTPKVEKHGWPALIPATVLLPIMEIQGWPAPDQQNSLAIELDRRLETPQLWQWQRRWVLHDALQRSLEFRRQWPDGMPLLVRLNPDPWLHSLRVFMDVDHHEVLFSHKQNYSIDGWRFAAEAGTIGSYDLLLAEDAETGPRTIAVEIVFSGIAPGATLYKEDRLEFSVRLPISSVTSIDDIITPVDTPELTAGALAAVQQIPWRTVCDPEVWIRRLHYPSAAWPRDVALAFDVRVYRDDVLVAEAIEPLADPEIDLPAGSVPSRVTFLQKCAEQYSTDGAWSVRVTANPFAALCQIDCDRYWAGEIELPLSRLPGLLAAIEDEQARLTRHADTLDERP